VSARGGGIENLNCEQKREEKNKFCEVKVKKIHHTMQAPRGCEKIWRR
jgi:hypothetical protein